MGVLWTGRIFVSCRIEDGRRKGVTERNNSRDETNCSRLGAPVLCLVYIICKCAVVHVFHGNGIGHVLCRSLNFG